MPEDNPRAVALMSLIFAVPCAILFLSGLSGGEVWGTTAISIGPERVSREEEPFFYWTNLLVYGFAAAAFLWVFLKKIGR